MANSKSMVNNPAVVYDRLRTEVRHRIVTIPNTQRAALRTKDQFRDEISKQLTRICSDERIELDDRDHNHIVKEILDEIFGFGPLDELMKDPKVSDVLVNGPDHVYVERDGVLHATDVKFPDNDFLMSFIRRLVSLVGRRIDESAPFVDARLPDGSRLNAIIPPLSLRGPTLSIRRFQDRPFFLEDMMEMRTLSQEMAIFLSKAVEARITVLISGATGAGKTTLLNALSRFIPRSERVITIEQTAELQLQQPDVVALETRPPNIEGRGEVHIRDLVRNALRMRPDRIIIGECRGAEVFDVLQAMLTGHDGSMSTVHAGDARDALRRMEVMMGLSHTDLPRYVLREYVATAVKMVVHMRRFPGGERKVVQISEVAGFTEDRILIDDIFRYEHTGYDSTGATSGYFHATRHVPKFMDQFADLGVDCPLDIFQPSQNAIEQRDEANARPVG